MERFLDEAILVTIDVVGLYPNIPHDQGLEALRRSNPAIPTGHVTDWWNWFSRIITLNLMAAIFFTKAWHSHRYKDNACMLAHAYANLFMHNLESQLLNLAPVKPYLWLRYIDDIFMIWTTGEQLLLEFLQWIN